MFARGSNYKGVDERVLHGDGTVQYLQIHYIDLYMGPKCIELHTHIYTYIHSEFM